MPVAIRRRMVVDHCAQDGIRLPFPAPTFIAALRRTPAILRSNAGSASSLNRLLHCNVGDVCEPP
jgi:hypothetical protein